ncbi:hypothetical protein M011DRAFT_493725 [Sporormia fimetaria CBS 119925]|uniref:Aminodeoxychorismate lyase n=1 Tax=Sporormia fimetaria CBS 119925 TaxID=1340428 RepID=A0A6A6VEY6_9PLEO|nr:hypothetical protein M011DRAFT_493725 [Sporormia fimetaria CBS 119925]
MATPSTTPDFCIFTSLRYDPLLLTSPENSRPELNFVSPSPFYILVYHRDRLLEAAQYFDFQAAIKQLADGKALHEYLLQVVQRHISDGGKDEPLKIRLLFDKNGTMSADTTSVPPVTLEELFPKSLDPAKQAEQSKQPGPWLVGLDKEPTPSSPFTLLKTTMRDLYNSARARSLPENPEDPMRTEVMLYNECDEVAEGTFTSLYLFRGGRWVTPPVGVPSGSFDATTLRGETWDEGEMRMPFAGRWGHSLRSAKVGAGGQRGTTRRYALSKGMCMEEPIGVDTVRPGEIVWVSSGVRGFQLGKVVE